MIRYYASWVVPVAAPPIRNGWVDVHDGRIVAVGAAPGVAHHDQRDLGHMAILPGLVNAHTHLELSFLHGRVPPSDDFNRWVMTMMAQRRNSALKPSDPPVLEAARAAIAQARATGTAVIGDIANSHITMDLLAAAHMPAQVFLELIGFNVTDAAARVREVRDALGGMPEDTGSDVRVSLAPHAPYSVAPSLFRAIRSDVDAHPPSITTVHLGESPAEVELMMHGTGRMRQMLETFGVWTDAWEVPGVSPAAYVAGLEFLDARTLVVHGVQFTREDLAIVRACGSTLVTCPRSNVYVGVGSPPLESFYDAGVPVAFGTDSLASCEDLNLFAELAEARRIAPRVSASRLLESATRQGAQALGFSADYGTIEPGKRARLVCIPIPDGLDGVEEYLVSGIRPSAIRWLDEPF